MRSSPRFMIGVQLCTSTPSTGRTVHNGVFQKSEAFCRSLLVPLFRPVSLSVPMFRKNLHLNQVPPPFPWFGVTCVTRFDYLNNTYSAIQAQLMPTNGDNRSPMRLSFQQNPNRPSRCRWAGRDGSRGFCRIWNREE